MIRVASYRFAIFFEKFGRLLEPDEELFFDESRAEPVRASASEIRRQIFAAAQAHRLNYQVLLNYLGLNSAASHREQTL